MRILIYEHLCAGGLGERPAPSLLREGLAMLRAVVADFAACEGVEVLVQVAPWFDKPLATKMIHAPATAFGELIRRADAILAIAPEFDGILERLSVQTAEADRQWLGCSPDAIRLTADKRALGEWWLSRGVPTPRFADPSLRGPFVVKPRFGAGSQDTCKIESAPSLNTDDGFVVQEFVAGLPASVAFLCGPHRHHPLKAAEQRLSQDGTFQYLGGRVPLPSDLAARALALAEHALQGIEGLSGWVGVDLILGSTAADDLAIEINPRLTTSYVGLRQLARTNLAEAWLHVVRGEPAKLTWHGGPVAFDADGSTSR